MSQHNIQSFSDKLYTKLCNKFKKNSVIALWATTKPRNSVDILLSFRRKLKEKGYPCILFLRNNAVDEFLSLAHKDDFDNLIYTLEDSLLLQHCDFISALFSHDYCCDKNILQFPSKLYFFQHNIQTTGPYPLRDMYIDGLITPSTKYKDIDYTFFPNSMKRAFTKNITIIPAGYPKIDLLIEKENQIKRPSRILTYYPCQLQSLAAYGIITKVQHLLHDFLTQFFIEFPDWQFILRPFPPDRQASIFHDLEEQFRNTPFKLDCGNNNIESLISSDIFITDFSSTYKNYAYTTLRPTIFLRPDKYQSHITDFGYLVTNAQETLAAFKEALAKLEYWNQTLYKSRQLELANPGETLSYLTSHIEQLLDGTKNSDWIYIPKYDTPCTQLSDWLKRFSLPILEKCGNFLPPLLTEAYKLCGKKDPRLALAALKSYLRIWIDAKPGFSNHWIQLSKRTSEALEDTPLSWSIALLRHFIQNFPTDGILYYYLAESLLKQNSNRSQQEAISLLSSLPVHNLNINASATGKLARLMLRQGLLREAIQIFSRDIADIHNIPAEARHLYASVLLYTKRYDTLSEFIAIWEKDVIQKQSYGLLFFKTLQNNINKEINPDIFFTSNNKDYSITLYDIPFYFKSISNAAKTLRSIFPVFLAEARLTPSLYLQTLSVARLCRMGDGVALCAWEMFKARILSPKLMQELEAEGFGPKLTGLRQVLDRFVKTHRSSHSSIQ